MLCLVTLAIFVLYRLVTGEIESREGSGVFSGAQQQEESNALVVDAAWLANNLYKVQIYKENEDGTFNVVLLEVEPSKGETFEELQTLFYSTPYSLINSYNLADGVNCQGMVCYLADWCQKAGVEYTIGYSSTHVVISIPNDGEWYKFSFTDRPSIIKVK